MAGRSITDAQRDWLDVELDQWTREGIVSTEQSVRIRACYETTALRGERKQAFARFVLQGLAALMVGLAALLLVGYNWDQMHWVAKLALVFGSVAGTHAAAFILQGSAKYPRASELLYFLGCLFYGAGIWLVAQVFHLDAHYPDGVWWWAVGVLPFALCLDTLLLHALLVGLLATWAWMEVINFGHLSPFWWGGNLPNGAYSMPLLAAPGFVWAYRRQSFLAVALYAGVLAWWIVLQAIAWELEWQSVYVVGLIGAVFLIVAENHVRGSRLSVPYRVYGTLLVGGALIPPSFYEFHNNSGTWYAYGSRLQPAFVQLVLFLVVLSSLVAFTWLLRPLGAGASANPFARLLELARRQWMPFALVLVMAALAVLGYVPEARLPATILANLAMLAFAIWLMHLGLRDERGWFFTAGVIYFLAWSVFRYFDLFGDAGGMLGAALLFLLCGAVLFGLTMLWGKRKALHHDA